MKNFDWHLLVLVMISLIFWTVGVLALPDEFLRTTGTKSIFIFGLLVFLMLSIVRFYPKKEIVPEDQIMYMNGRWYPSGDTYKVRPWLKYEREFITLPILVTTDRFDDVNLADGVFHLSAHTAVHVSAIHNEDSSMTPSELKSFVNGTLTRHLHDAIDYKDEMTLGQLVEYLQLDRRDMNWKKNPSIEFRFPIAVMAHADEPNMESRTATIHRL